MCLIEIKRQKFFSSEKLGFFRYNIRINEQYVLNKPLNETQSCFLNKPLNKTQCVSNNKPLNKTHTSVLHNNPLIKTQSCVLNNPINKTQPCVWRVMSMSETCLDMCQVCAVDSNQSINTRTTIFLAFFSRCAAMAASTHLLSLS